MVKRFGEFLPQEEERGCEPFRGVGLYGSICLGICQALPEELDGEPLLSCLVVNACKTTQGLGTQRDCACTLGRFREQHAGTSGAAGLEVGFPGVEPALMGGLNLGLRREAECELAQLGRSLRCTACTCDARRLVERGRDVRIHALRAKREMARPLLGVREADTVAIQLDQLRVDAAP